MIHVNNGNQPHEWLTQEEFDKKYPGLQAKINGMRQQKGLRERREAARMTLRELSQITGIDGITLSDAEIGAEVLEESLYRKVVAALEAAEEANR
jgi:hypothetical protein